MKTINKPVLAVFAMLVASVFAVAAEPRDKPGEPETGGTTETKQGYAAVNGQLGPEVLVGWPNRIMILAHCAWLMPVAWHAITLSSRSTTQYSGSPS